MDQENMEARIARLEAHRAAGTLHPDGYGDGHETACLITAIAPEVAARSYDVTRCPPEVMALWFALLTPLLYDCCSSAARDGIVDRFISLARRWSILGAAGWRRAEYRVRIAFIREAMAHTDNMDVIAICGRATVLFDRAADGEKSITGERLELAEAARAAVRSTEWGSPAEVVAWAAYSAVKEGVELAVKYPVDAAIRAAWQKKEVVEGAKGVAEVGKVAQAAWDRIAEAVFDALEVEISAMEQK